MARKWKSFRFRFLCQVSLPAWSLQVTCLESSQNCFYIISWLSEDILGSEDFLPIPPPSLSAGFPSPSPRPTLHSLFGIPGRRPSPAGEARMHGEWGSWARCPSGYAVMGLMTMVEQGHPFEDDAGLCNLTMYCMPK